MIRGLAVAVALLAGPTAASAEVVFTGTIIHTDVSGACENRHVGERYPSVYHPNVADNADFAGLSWIRGDYANGHALEGGNFNQNFQTVITGGVGWGDAFFRPPEQRAKIRITSSSPATGNIDDETETVTIRGQIKRPFNDPGGLNCTVTFLGTYVKDVFE